MSPLSAAAIWPPLLDPLGDAASVAADVMQQGSHLLHSLGPPALKSVDNKLFHSAIMACVDLGLAGVASARVRRGKLALHRRKRNRRLG